MKFQIKSSVGGLADYEDKGIFGATKFLSGLDIRKKVDSLSCQQALVNEVGEFSGLIMWMVPCNDGHTYGFDDTGKIYRRDLTTKEWSTVYTETGGAILGAAEFFHRIEDVETPYLYWADAGGNVHRKLIPGESNWSDVDDDEGWPKTGLEDVELHTMLFTGSELLIANGSFAAVVGRDSSFSVEAVQIPPNERITSMVLRGASQDIIFGSKRINELARCHLYSWQPGSDQVNPFHYPFPAKGINAMVDAEFPLMQAGTQGKIFYSDLYNKISVQEFPGGGQVLPDGVDVDEGIALFGVFNGNDIDGETTNGIYTVGRKKKNAPYVINLDHPIDCDQIGSVVNIGTDILASCRVGDTYTVKRVDSLSKSRGLYHSLDLIAPSEFQTAVIWQYVSLHTKQMPENTAIECWYRVNKIGEFLQAKMEGEVNQHTEGDEGIFLIGAEGKILEIKIVLVPHGNETPEVYFPIDIFFS